MARKQGGGDGGPRQHPDFIVKMAEERAEDLYNRAQNAEARERALKEELEQERAKNKTGQSAEKSNETGSEKAPGDTVDKYTPEQIAGMSAEELKKLKESSTKEDWKKYTDGLTDEQKKVINEKFPDGLNDASLASATDTSDKKITEGSSWFMKPARALKLAGGTAAGGLAVGFVAKVLARAALSKGIKYTAITLTGGTGLAIAAGAGATAGALFEGIKAFGEEKKLAEFAGMSLAIEDLQTNTELSSLDKVQKLIALKHQAENYKTPESLKDAFTVLHAKIEAVDLATFLNEQDWPKAEKADDTVKRLEAFISARGKAEQDYFYANPENKALLKKIQKENKETGSVDSKKIAMRALQGALIGGVSATAGAWVGEWLGAKLGAALDSGQGIHNAASGAIEHKTGTLADVVKAGMEHGGGAKEALSDSQVMHKGDTVWGMVKHWYEAAGVPHDKINNQLINEGMKMIADQNSVDITAFQDAHDLSSLKDIKMPIGTELHGFGSLKEVLEHKGMHIPGLEHAAGASGELSQEQLEAIKEAARQGAEQGANASKEAVDSGLFSKKTLLWGAFTAMLVSGVALPLYLSRKHAKAPKPGAPGANQGGIFSNLKQKFKDRFKRGEKEEAKTETLADRFPEGEHRTLAEQALEKKLTTEAQLKSYVELLRKGGILDDLVENGLLSAAERKGYASRIERVTDFSQPEARDTLQQLVEGITKPIEEAIKRNDQPAVDAGNNFIDALDALHPLVSKPDFKTVTPESSQELEDLEKEAEKHNVEPDRKKYWVALFRQDEHGALQKAVASGEISQAEADEYGKTLKDIPDYEKIEDRKLHTVCDNFLIPVILKHPNLSSPELNHLMDTTKNIFDLADQNKIEDRLDEKLKSAQEKNKQQEGWKAERIKEAQGLKIPSQEGQEIFVTLTDEKKGLLKAAEADDNKALTPGLAAEIRKLIREQKDYSTGTANVTAIEKIFGILVNRQFEVHGKGVDASNQKPYSTLRSIINNLRKLNPDLPIFKHSEEKLRELYLPDEDYADYALDQNEWKTFPLGIKDRPAKKAWIMLIKERGLIDGLVANIAQPDDIKEMRTTLEDSSLDFDNLQQTQEQALKEKVVKVVTEAHERLKDKTGDFRLIRLEKTTETLSKLHPKLNDLLTA